MTTPSEGEQEPQGPEDAPIEIPDLKFDTIFKDHVPDTESRDN